MREMGYEGVNWIHLAQDRVQWRALLNTVMNLKTEYKRGICGLAERELFSQEPSKHDNYHVRLRKAIHWSNFLTRSISGRSYPLFEILSSGASEDEDDTFLWCCNVQPHGNRPTFQICLLPPLSGRWISHYLEIQESVGSSKILVIHRPGDGGSTHLWNVGLLPWDYGRSIQESCTSSYPVSVIKNYSRLMKVSSYNVYRSFLKKPRLLLRTC
jgi:hypothetical protein